MSIIRHLLLENRYQKEITEKHYRAYVKSKEIEMITRQERIKEVIYKNRNELGYKSSSFYAEAFVDGQIEAEKEQAQRFYNKVMSAGEHERQVIMLCGRETSEVAKALEFYDKHGSSDEKWTEFQLNIEGKKMTREDAMRILNNAKWADAKRFLNTLEALGLIKFDEPKVELIIDNVKDYDGDIQKLYLKDMIEALFRYGYKVGKEADLVPYKTPDDAAFIMELKQQGYRIIKEDNPK